jgi:arginase family enzyme
MADAGDVAIQGADTAANHDRIGPRTVVAETVPRGQGLYVSIDHDGLDPSVAPAFPCPRWRAAGG